MRSGGIDRECAARERPDDRGDGLQQERTGDGTAEADERRVGRGRTAVQEVRREPRADDRPAASPARESAVAISPRLSPESAESAGDRQRDPVDAGHAAILAGRRSIPAAATLPAVPGA